MSGGHRAAAKAKLGTRRGRRELIAAFCAFWWGHEAGSAAMEVESSAISEIDYDEERAKLLVRFASGERYVYVGVPGEVHRSFVDAESKGRFFQAEIRDQYPYNRLEG